MKHSFALHCTFGLLALPLLIAGALPAISAPHAAAPAKVAKADHNPKKISPLQRAAAILGKPLSPAQKVALQAAHKQRQAANKAANDRYRVSAAKILGLSLAQYQAKEKALFGAKKH